MGLSAQLQQLANGISVGSLYALVAIGYTMVYGILRLINFAHGDVFMMAMYFAFFSVTVFHLPWAVSIVAVVLLTALLGMAIERAAYRPLREAPRISLLISSIGVSYLLENLATVLFSGVPRQFPSLPYMQGIITIGTVRVQRLALAVPVITVVLVLGLMYLINHTKIGMAMRAVAKDFDASRLMGINVNQIIAATFGVGSLLAATGAVMWGFKYPQIQPYVGVMPGLKCFIAAVIGGIGNIKGAVVGGLILGILEVMVTYWWSSISGYKDVFAFAALIIILLVKPTGLFGEKATDKV